MQGCPTADAIDSAGANSRLTAMAYKAVLSGYSDYDFDFGALHVRCLYKTDLSVCILLALEQISVLYSTFQCALASLFLVRCS